MQPYAKAVIRNAWKWITAQQPTTFAWRDEEFVGFLTDPVRSNQFEHGGNVVGIDAVLIVDAGAIDMDDHPQVGDTLKVIVREGGSTENDAVQGAVYRVLSYRRTADVGITFQLKGPDAA